MEWASVVREAKAKVKGQRAKERGGGGRGG
jgi:hypothetical protein